MYIPYEDPDPRLQRIIAAIEYAAELVTYDYEESEVLEKLGLEEPESQADADFDDHGIGKWGFV